MIGLIFLIPGILFTLTCSGESCMGGSILFLPFLPVLLLLSPIGDYIYQTYRVADISPTGAVMYSLPNKFMILRGVIFFIGIAIYTFLVGALIGWFYGKIKNRNK